jgi:hypothetical protein
MIGMPKERDKSLRTYCIPIRPSVITGKSKSKAIPVTGRGGL